MKKKAAAEVDNGSLKVWCEHCSIRIAPSEMKVASDGKVYHERCYEKSSAGSRVVGVSSRPRNLLGHEQSECEPDRAKPSRT